MEVMELKGGNSLAVPGREQDMSKGEWLPGYQSDLVLADEESEKPFVPLSQNLFER